MRERSIKSLYHHFVKGIAVLFPVFLIFIASNPKIKQESEVPIYQTNEINSVDDFVKGNIYQLKVDNYYIETDYDSLSFDLFCSYLYFYFDSSISESEIYIDEITFENVFINRIYFSRADSIWFTSNNYNCISYNDELTYLSNLCYIGDYTDTNTFYFLFVFDSFDNYGTEEGFNDFFDDNIGFFSSCPIDLIPKEKVNNIKADVLDFGLKFYNSDINSWYRSLMNTMQFNINNNLYSLIYVYPLYILWVYVLDLVLDCFLVIPKLFHEMLEDFGGKHDRY